MKKFLFITLALLFCINITNATTKKTTNLPYNLQYCTDNIDLHLGGQPVDVTVKSAIQLPATTMSSYTGTTMGAISVGIADHTGINDFKLYIWEKLTSQPVYSQDVSEIKTGWNTITLNTPFEITGKEIFIGYGFTMPKEKNSIGISENEISQYGNWTELDGQPWAHYPPEFVAGNNCIIGLISGNDIKLSEIRTNKYVKPNEEFELKGTIINKTGTTLTSFDVTYKAGSSEEVTFNVSGINIKYNESYIFTAPEKLTLAEGNWDLTVTVSNPNGSQDAFTEDNTATRNIISGNTNIQRKVIMENFTNENADNSVMGESILASAIATEQNIIRISHHAGGEKDDQFTTAESKFYEWFYNKDVFLPAVMLDRTFIVPEGEDNKGPLFFPQESYMSEFIKKSLDIPAYITVNIEGTYNQETSEFNITVSGNTTSEFKESSIRLTVVLTEDNVLSKKQKGFTGVYTHNNLIRRVISEPLGNSVTITEGKYSKEYKFKLDSKWMPQNMKIIAFANKYDATNPNNSEIYNGDQILISSLIPQDCKLVSLNNDPILGGVLKGAGYYKEGQSVTITTTDMDNYGFSNWNLNGSNVSSDRSYTFTMGNEPLSYTAIYEPAYKITVKASPATQGTAEGTGYYKEGETVTITAIAKEGFEFVKWTVGGKEVSTEATYSFTMTNKTATYTANFIDPTSVKNEDTININIYPNPADNILNIEGSFDYLQIIDITGKQIKEYKSDFKSLDVSDLKTGIYFIKLYYGNSVKTQKIIINR